MSDKSKAKKIAVAVVLSAALVCALIAADVYKKDYDTLEKSSVAMGTTLTARLYGNADEKQLSLLMRRLSTLEGEISWRIDGSAVSRLNSGEAVESETLSKIVSSCNDVYLSSGGAFDVTVGSVASLWDIGGENARVPSHEEIETALSRVDGSRLSVSGYAVSASSGQLCDFGAVGKGYACDAAAEYLRNTAVSGAVVSAGGSVLLYGTHNRAHDSWRVAVRSPSGGESDYVGIISLKEGFVSTSGSYERTLESGGRLYHHIIDPATGYPAESGLLSVTVVSSSGLLSDALSTACFVLGIEEGAALLNEYAAQGVFIDEENNIYVTGGLSGSFELTNDSFTLRTF